MSSSDKTKDVLEQVLAQLYAEQAKEANPQGESYLLGGDDQLIGKISSNRYDTDSLLNKYGPFGSSYSNTSIFNPYSPYGSKYGQFSMNNPYCTQPPRLFLNGKFITYVTSNRYISPRIAPESFLHALNNNLNDLLRGMIVESESHARQLAGYAFIEAQDGIFLGKLTPNKFDPESIFNKFSPYGNEYSPSSIFNKFSQYGNQFSPLSAFNIYANAPPKILIGDKFVGFLSLNQYQQPNIDPNNIEEWASRNLSEF